MTRRRWRVTAILLLAVLIAAEWFTTHHGTHEEMYCYDPGKDNRVCSADGTACWGTITKFCRVP